MRDSGRGFGASVEAQLRVKTVTLQVGSVGRYRTFPEALSSGANTGRRETPGLLPGKDHRKEGKDQGRVPPLHPTPTPGEEKEGTHFPARSFLCCSPSELP